MAFSLWIFVRPVEASMLFLVRVFFVLWIAVYSAAVSGAEFSSENFDGPRYHVYLEGLIKPGDGDKFKEFILSEIRNGHLISALYLNTPGGNVPAALQIGEQVRLLGIATQAPSKFSDGAYCYHGAIDRQSTANGCECASACFLIWASGTGRFGTYVGIHHPYYTGDSYKNLDPAEAEKQYTEMSDNVVSYLKEMGIPGDIRNKMLRYMSYDIYYLSSDELEALRPMPPWLSQLLYDRCGKMPSGSSVPSSPEYNPERKTFLDCQSPMYEQIYKKSHQRFLDKYGRPGEQLSPTTPPPVTSIPPAASNPPPQITVRTVHIEIPPQGAPDQPKPNLAITRYGSDKIVETDGASSDYLIRDNRDLDGIDIKPYQKGFGQDDCARSCTGTPECQGFSYDSWNLLCIMKSQITGSRLEPRSISGVSRRNFQEFPTAVEDAAKMQRYSNAYFPGDGANSVMTNDANSCSNTCFTSRSCVTFTYYKDTHICRMFKSSGSYLHGNSNADSGVKTQSP
jgi:hypothetical protein